MLLLLLACGSPPESPDWLDERAPSGPCYDANLLDGLSEESTDELHDVFDCLNQSDNFVALSDTIDALDAPTRSGAPGGVELARLLNGAGTAEIDLGALLDTALLLVEPDADGQRPMDPLLDLTLELSYGIRAPRLRAGEVDLRAPDALDAGIIAPLMPGLGALATAALDDNLAATTALADALRDPELPRIVHTLDAWRQSTNDELAATTAELPAQLGALIADSRSPDNDRWGSASGNSLADLLDPVLHDTGNDGRLVLEHLADPARTMLDDEALGRRMELALSELSDQGHLSPLPPQLLYLTQVDVNGDGLESGEDSAFVSLIRLLRNGDKPMECSLDLWVTNLSVDFDNLSVLLLETIAQQDSGTVQGGVDLLGTVIGWSFSQGVLEAIADSGVCDTLDAQMVEDLESIDRFNDPEVGDLLATFLVLLDAVYGDGDSSVPELVDLISTAHRNQLTKPIEELLRDMGTGGLVRDVIGLVPVLLDPRDYVSDFPAEYEPLDFEGVWILAGRMVSVRAGDRSQLGTIAPLLTALTDADESSAAIGNLAGLLQDPDSETAALLTSLLPLWLELDPELALLERAAPLLDDPTLAEPVFGMLESPEFRAALTDAPSPDEGPVPFYARMVIGGTLDAALALLDWTLGLLGADD